MHHACLQIGTVVFTGADTKIMMNRTPAPRKITQLERHMNVLVAAMFGVLMFIACWMAGAEQIWYRKHDPDSQWYLRLEYTWPDLGPVSGKQDHAAVHRLILGHETCLNHHTHFNRMVWSVVVFLLYRYKQGCGHKPYWPVWPC